MNSMERVEIPVLTGENFQIHEAHFRDGKWHVVASFGHVQMRFGVEGGVEHLLQVLTTLGQSQEHLRSLSGRVSFTIIGSQVEGEGLSLPAKRVDPFLIRIFKANLHD